MAAVPALERGLRRPELSHLHALLGRCIFARYLEDRDIINRDYFEKVADRHGRKSWQNLLDRPLTAAPIDPSMGSILFLRVLRSIEFTYALFDQFASDFNGDTFPVETAEHERVHQGHLDELLAFLCGARSSQQELFFYAYRFDVIPIELISSIYEEFYNERAGKDRNQGSHYTPPALVEFVLAHSLTPAILAKKPRVFDASCGSGIFLVESFRRMVRYLWAERGGKAPSRDELKRILRDQIAGVDLNPEAVRVAAFSLYLAFLHYQHPRDINEQRRLPYLKWVDDTERQQRLTCDPAAEFCDVLLHANAFDIVNGKLSDGVIKRFGPDTADVVVGNPPWGYPKREDETGRKALASTLAWCRPELGRPIGDQELSQAFVHLSIALLKVGGRAGLLLSSGVLFKHQPNSRAFRHAWLGAVALQHVVNFAHVRHVFFTGSHREAQGVAPFVSVVSDKRSSRLTEKHRFPYWSAKRTVSVENTQAIILNRGDLHYLDQMECLENDKLWKIYWWGGRRDKILIKTLERHPPLIDLLESAPPAAITSGYGFLEGNHHYPSDWLSGYKELPVSQLVFCGSLKVETLVTPPKRVARRGQREVYEGSRLLIRRGVPMGGELSVRLEDKPYTFRHSIFGFRLEGLTEWQRRTVAGVFASSLARYYLFCSSGSWGMWHDELLIETVAAMPVRFPAKEHDAGRVVDVVARLQSLELQPEGMELLGQSAQRALPGLKRELDDAIFDLYGLDEAERDLVNDMCSLGLDLFYRHQNSDAVAEIALPAQHWGNAADVAGSTGGLGAYIRVFLQQWNLELEPSGEFAWRVLSPPSQAPLLAIMFETRSKGNARQSFGTTDRLAWKTVLQKLAENAVMPFACSQVLVDTFFRSVSEHEIFIVKRNELRFWTKSAAREDAEATLLQSMILYEEKDREDKLSPANRTE